MATTLYFRDQASDIDPGGNIEKMMSPARGSAAVTKATGAASGPTSGVQVTDGIGGTAIEWYTLPLKAVTIAGSITFNIRGFESAAQVNAGFEVKIERCNSAGAVQSTIIDSERGTEMGTSESANSWSASPTSTAISDGDRLKITILGNDAGGTMSGTGGRNFSTVYDGLSGASGDSFVTFTENLVQLILPSAIASSENVPTTARLAFNPSTILPSAIASGEVVSSPSIGRFIRLTPVDGTPAGTWETGPTLGSTALLGLACGGGWWVVISATQIYYTQNPKGSWTTRAGGPFSSLNRVSYRNGKFWVMARNESAADPSGAWTLGAVSPVGIAFLDYNAAAGLYGGNGSEPLGTSVQFSYAANPLTANPWTNRNLVNLERFTGHKMASDGTYWVAPGQSPTRGIWWNTDVTANAWTLTQVGTAVDYYSIHYYNGLFVLVGSAGRIAYCSGDPSVSGNWTTQTVGATAFYSIDHDGTYWIAAGPSGHLAYTTDPSLGWTSNDQVSTHRTNEIAGDGTYWVAAGQDGSGNPSMLIRQLGPGFVGGIPTAEAIGSSTVVLGDPPGISSPSLVIPPKLRGYRALIMR